MLHDVPRNWLHDRVDEWHQRNLGQMASQMLLEVAAAKTVSAPSSDVAGQSYLSYPMQATGQGLEVLQLGLYALRQHAGPRPDTAAGPRPTCENMGPAQGGSSSSGNNGPTTSPFKGERPLRQEDNSMKITEIQEAPAHPFAGLDRAEDHANHSAQRRTSLHDNSKDIG